MKKKDTNNILSACKNYIEYSKQYKLIKKFPKYLKSKRKALIKKFGKEKTGLILIKAKEAYPTILEKTPSYNTPMYDSLILLAGKMAALKKGMKEVGINTKEFVKFSIEDTRSAAKKLPAFLRRLGGKIYLSKLMRVYLKKVAKSASANGWPTKLINGSRRDVYTMCIETRNCQMVAFWESIGEGDIKPYCSFFDFTAAELLNFGLKQVSNIDSGVCKYCFYTKGKVLWPDNIQSLLAS